MMKKWTRYFFLFLILVVISPAIGKAQQASDLIDQFEAGQMPIDAAEIPLLIPFARQWDKLAAPEKDSEELPRADHYQMLAIPDEGRLKETIDALTRNDEAVKFFTQDETIEAFNQTYQRAVDSGSSIGMIPHDKALKYWIASRALTAGPEALAAYPGGGTSPQWCLPPLISCTPPQPPPTE